MDISFDTVQEVAELAYIIRHETGFGYAISSVIAERIYAEGYRKIDVEDECANQPTSEQGLTPSL